MIKLLRNVVQKVRKSFRKDNTTESTSDASNPSGYNLRSRTAIAKPSGIISGRKTYRKRRGAEIDIPVVQKNLCLHQSRDLTTPSPPYEDAVEALVATDSPSPTYEDAVEIADNTPIVTTPKSERKGVKRRNLYLRRLGPSSKKSCVPEKENIPPTNVLEKEHEIRQVAKTLDSREQPIIVSEMVTVPELLQPEQAVLPICRRATAVQVVVKENIPPTNVLEKEHECRQVAKTLDSREQPVIVSEVVTVPELLQPEQAVLPICRRATAVQDNIVELAALESELPILIPELVTVVPEQSQPDQAILSLDRRATATQDNLVEPPTVQDAPDIVPEVLPTVPELLQPQQAILPRQRAPRRKPVIARPAAECALEHPPTRDELVEPPTVQELQLPEVLPTVPPLQPQLAIQPRQRAPRRKRETARPTEYAPEQPPFHFGGPPTRAMRRRTGLRVLPYINYKDTMTRRPNGWWRLEAECRLNLLRPIIVVN